MQQLEPPHMQPKKRYPTFGEYLKAEYQGPYSATDILIRYDVKGEEGLVLIERKNFPHGLAMPGGMAERMELADNAIKEAKEETGLEVILDGPKWKPFGVFSRTDHDPRAFISSTVYTARGYGTLKPHPDEDAISAKAYTLPEIKQLLQKPEKWAFASHRDIVELYTLHRFGGLE